MGGNDQFVIYGQAFSGDFWGTTWPGHVVCDYLNADAWGPRRRDWSHELKATHYYIGRVMYIQQQGVVRSDVAIYNKERWVKATDLPFNTTRVLIWKMLSMEVSKHETSQKYRR